jgi:RNA polymerase sigma-70 factor (ECF subfamily)
MRNHRRSARRRDAALRRVRTEVAIEGFADDVAARVDDENTMRRLLDLISSMSVQEREVISLVLWSGLTYEEAAVALGVAVGTVKSRLSRAKRRLVELAVANGHDIGEDSALARASAIEPRKAEG